MAAVEQTVTDDARRHDVESWLGGAFPPVHVRQRPGRSPWLVLAIAAGLPGLPMAIAFVIGIYLAANPDGLSAVVAAGPAPPAPAVPGRVAAAAWGVAGGLLLGALVAAVVRRRSTCRSCNTSEHGALRARLDELRQSLGAAHRWLVCGGADGATWDGWFWSQAHAAALEQLVDSTQPDLQWAAGDGYINAWRELHRAEEALLLSAPTSAVVGAASDVELRLYHCGVPTLDALTCRLRLAVAAVRPAAVTFLTTVPAGSAQAAPAGGATAGPTPADGRAILRNVSRTLNEHRDDIWDKLSSARGRLLANVTLAWLLVTVLVVALVLGGVSPRGLLSGALFFVAGAIAGAISDLSQQTLHQSAVQDYGLGRARLLANVLLAGLAALAGVVLVTFVGLPILGQNVAASAARLAFGVASAARPGTGFVDWSQVFDWSGNGAGFLVALVFGFAPVRLVGLLQADQATATQQLRSTDSMGAAS